MLGVQGVLNNPFESPIERCELEPGDHIYSWRNVGVYAHHGIFVGYMEGMANVVIHFTSGPLESGASASSSTSSSSSSSGIRTHSQCNKSPKEGHGVISSCLDCFLLGGSLYRFRYNVNIDLYNLMQTTLCNPMLITCTFLREDTNENAIIRAKHCLDVGFGSYHLVSRNCIDFATYCKVRSFPPPPPPLAPAPALAMLPLPNHSKIKNQEKKKGVLELLFGKKLKIPTLFEERVCSPSRLLEL